MLFVTQEKVFIVSGVNLVSGGTLAIFKDCLASLAEWKTADIKIIALVNNKALFAGIGEDDIKYIEFPDVKKRWVKRLVFEYYTCLKLSKQYKPHTWLSMHDVTPNVIANKRIVYCHNPVPFYRLSLREMFMQKTLLAFKLFYKLLYRINIKKNTFVIVQQSWMRDLFKKWFNINNVVVAHPTVNYNMVKNEDGVAVGDKYVFLYPALPRAFKNFEVLFDAALKLNQAQSNFQVVVTISGTENKYAQHLYKKYGNVDVIKFAGLQTKQQLAQLYQTASCVVFPSKLETWGLPITEAIFFNKPLLVADCLYAHETCGNYKNVCYFDANRSEKLADLMLKAINNRLQYNAAFYTPPQQPFATGWQHLFNLVLK